MIERERERKKESEYRLVINIEKINEYLKHKFTEFTFTFSHNNILLFSFKYSKFYFLRSKSYIKSKRIKKKKKNTRRLIMLIILC